MIIVKIDDSSLKNKRFRVSLDDGSTFDFGDKNGQCYLDHHDKQMRQNYRKRHIANRRENELITKLIPSPSLFSYYLLWGDSTSLVKNIEELNRKMNYNNRLI